MALTIQVRSEDAEVPPVTFDAPRIILGRGPGSDVRLPDASVSRRHASVRQRGAEYIVLDEGSINGTFVGKTRLAPGAPHVVRSGDIVRCGLVELELRLESTAATPNPQHLTREIALLLIEGALATDGKQTAPFIIVRGGLDDGREFSLDEPGKLYVVGRGPQSDFDLQDEDISRRHVGIERHIGDVVVSDLAAKNPIKLGDETLPASGEHRWNPKLTLKLSASTSLELRDPLSETLLEIEAAADEAMASRPSQAAMAETAGRPSTPPGNASPSDPPALRPHARAERPRSWTSSDIIIGLLALAILGASITGMYWLARS